METLYRYTKYCNEETLSYGCDEDFVSNVRLQLKEYQVIRETKEFYIFREHGSYGKEKRTSKYATRRFAYPTKKEALISFMARARRSITINKIQIEYSQLAIIEAEKLLTS